MIDQEHFRAFVLSLPETTEAPHFEITAFRVKKKVFATLNVEKGHATLRLTPELQDVFCAVGKGGVYPVPNKWGSHGWTHLNLEATEWELCKDALRTAWWELAPKTLREMHPEIAED